MDYLKLGNLAITNGDHQEALNIFRRILERGPNAKAFVGFGIASMALGDPATARWAYAKALELVPADPVANAGFDRAVSTLASQASFTPQRLARFRVGEGFLEIDRNGWQRFFVKGINLGLGLPGFFPGEYPIAKGTYLKWFTQMVALGINVVRIYTVHPPAFYEALAEFNDQKKRLFLLQGVWLELPERSDFQAAHYIKYVQKNVRESVDVVFGAAELSERPGYAHGAYRADVSPLLLGFLLGREWESCAVKEFNELHGRRPADYQGRFLTVEQGSPFEVWIAWLGDYLADYETSSYGCSHPLSTICWPTLDPLSHPSESTYEEGLQRQGIHVSSTRCNENEDVESLDLSRITASKGGGFFATYHVYPYYPDFMNNDYLDEQHPYQTYLQKLKRHHGPQPVLIAEFGVPSSREVTHWQRQGWHHGGHDEVAQGTINARMIEEIHGAGMAGGVLFSWFDEWFKRNWLFSAYQVPAEHLPRWFNQQDAEQCYGLMACYPGYPDKAVSLAGRRGEWANATVLYENRSKHLTVRFNDGHDAARTLTRLAVQHDEGFLYLLLETAAPVDFSQANYLIGLATCGADAGESLLPLLDNVTCPVPLTFLVHLAGAERSRLLVCRSYDKYLNSDTGSIRPAGTGQGEWVVMQNLTGHRRISKDGSRFFPARVFPMSRLQYGSLATGHPRVNSLANLHVSGTMIELRLPWGLINISDPSSRQVVWVDKGTRSRTTPGIGIVAYSYKPSGTGYQARSSGEGQSVSAALPLHQERSAVARYSWDSWTFPIYHTHLKAGSALYRDALARLPE